MSWSFAVSTTVYGVAATSVPRRDLEPKWLRRPPSADRRRVVDHFDGQHHGGLTRERCGPALQRRCRNADRARQLAPPSAALALRRGPRRDFGAQRGRETKAWTLALQQVSCLAILHRTADLSTVRGSRQDGIGRGVTIKKPIRLQGLLDHHCSVGALAVHGIRKLQFALRIST
jgi:hypothetical protein